MKMLAMLTMSAAVLASTAIFTNASAQELTRAQVSQELVQAENNGSHLASDASDPDVDPIDQKQVARNNAQHPGSGEGAGMAGVTQSGNRTGITHNSMSNKPQTCAGPVSYCNIYFGS